MRGKNAQAIRTILTFGVVIIGLFILISGYPAWEEVIQEYVNDHPDNTFTNILVQLIPIFAVIFLILLLFIPNEVALFG